MNAPNSFIFNMTLRKSERKRKAVTIWEQKDAPPAARDPKIPKIAARTVKKNALKAVATGPLPKEVGFDSSAPLKLPDYSPPLKLRYKCSESIATGLSEL
jgi:hypothetical protein